jgi:hypothetical protein
MEQPHLRLQNQQVLATCPLDDWTTDSNAQLANATEHINKHARNFFQSDSFTPLQPYVSRTTIRLIRLRRFVLRTLRSPTPDDGTIHR